MLASVGLVALAACSSEAADPADSSIAATSAPDRAHPTPTPASPTAPVAGVGDFVESFDGNGGLGRFAFDVYHRDESMVAQRSWSGDHDVSCGSPDTQRTIHRDRPAESFYLCRDHLMTSVGDTSGYSIAWFSPDGDGDGRADVFSSTDTDVISWDVNVTHLGNRQWWEVVLVAEGAPFLTAIDWIATPGGIEAYHPETIAVGKGPIQIYSGGRDRDPLAWESVCGQFGVDPEGCASKAIRRSFSIRDNNDGTITYDFLGRQFTYAGEFPDKFEVYFKDHNYTPTKDGCGYYGGPCPGFTWHWDNIAVT